MFFTFLAFTLVEQKKQKVEVILAWVALAG